MKHLVNLTTHLGILFLFLMGQIVNAETYTMTVATVAPADSPWSALLVSFKENAEKKSAGKLKVKLMLGGALGDENEAVTKCSRGQIQAVAASTGALGSKIPELNVVELPFLFRTAEEADQVIDRVLTSEFDKIFRQRGLVLGFWSENGYRNFATSDKPVRSPTDLKGKKMRSQESQVHMQMYKAFGAAAVPIPTTEVPQALATKNVDGFDQALLYMIAAGWQQSIKFVTLSEHIYQPAAIAFNQKWFDSLPADLKKIIIEEGRAVQDKGRKAVRKIQPDLKEILKSEKITVVDLTTAEKRVFEEQSKPVYENFKKSFGPTAARILEAIQAELKKIRNEK
jgi:tripartite ATP-independent transporter DctP family solute receptor